mmetsp:Transcript_36023/g.84476  ORF Transcript_36023/g.84476 Transcript_36023/m.84476 type:complete len:282 (-) Transcript_36023:65-910(-)
MSTVGRMDGAFFVSRSELLSWANGTFDLNLSKVEQAANGAVYCQVIDACHPGGVMMKKVNWKARAEHEAIPNYKVLQQAFDRCKIEKHVEVDKLIRGKYQDNLEMLQWIKTYYDRTCAGNEYDGPSRRFGEVPDWAVAPAGGAGSRHPTEPMRATPSRGNEVRSMPSDSGRHSANRDSQSSLGARSGSGRAPAGGGRAPAAGGLRNGGEHDRLKEEEIIDLKITVDGLETERDFYFQKLRDIEILCQAFEATPNPNITVGKFVEDVQRILYAKDDEEEGHA